jgi:predicted lipoprotein with Yx(FWY)xxD motif
MLATLALAGCSASAGQSPATARIPQPLPATPVNITLVNVVQVVGVAPPDYLWTRLGDAHGKTLYTSAADTVPGVSRCVAECAKQFPPVLATAGATGFGDWSLVKRPEGTLQWAYQGKPLYTFVQEATVLQEVDALVAQGRPEGQGPPRRPAPAPKDLPRPPAGWTVARFNPEKNLLLPAPIRIQTLAVQDGMGDALVTAEGLTLYGFQGSERDAERAACVQPAYGDRDCSARFEPYLAPESATAVGDFSIVKGGPRGDARQWAYKGIALYTFSGDHKPTDAYGVYENHGPWQVVFVYLDAFPQNVQAIESVGHDKILADERGMPIYQRAHFRELFGGPTAYHDYGAAPYMGIAIGAGGCDAACLKVRRPVLAPADAQPHGDWMVYTRPDGSKQWAFQGFALYTYTGDTRPGIVNGHNVSDFFVGDAGPYKIVDATMGDPDGGGMGSGSHKAGLFWFVSHPDWLGR